jgi:hypothetical protein
MRNVCDGIDAYYICVHVHAYLGYCRTVAVTMVQALDVYNVHMDRRLDLPVRGDLISSPHAVVCVVY